MIHRRQGIIAIGVAFATTAGVYADTMPASASVGVPRSSAQACDRRACPSSSSPSPLVGSPIVDLHPRPIALLPATSADVQPTAETQTTLQLLDHDRSSLDLCLYVLMGLGLCKSAPRMMRLSFACIPDWYHHGGPSQIASSYAVGPNCLCSTAVCFVQPDAGADDFMPQHLLGTIASVWRKSQFKPTVLASRGPPLCPS
jgi:hypothetical protein